jgi:hypothetical protein
MQAHPIEPAAPLSGCSDATPYGVLNAGEFSLRCRACSWRTGPEPIPTGRDVWSFRAVRVAAEAAWREHQAQEHESEGAPESDGSPAPSIFPGMA